MSKVDDGGSAFPDSRVDEKGRMAFSPGMSLRDWLAGMAMQGYISSPQTLRIVLNGEHLHPTEAIESASYILADLMIAEKRRTENPNA